MRRKLGITLLMMMMVVSGTREAVKQFHELKSTVSDWTHASLWNGFLVFAQQPEQGFEAERVQQPVLAPNCHAAQALKVAAAETNLNDSAPLVAQAKGERTEAKRTAAAAHAVAGFSARESKNERAVSKHEALSKRAEKAESAALKNERARLNAERAIEIITRTIEESVRAAQANVAHAHETGEKIKFTRVKNSSQLFKMNRTLTFKIAQLDSNGECESKPREVKAMVVHQRLIPDVAPLAPADAPNGEHFFSERE